MSSLFFLLALVLGLGATSEARVITEQEAIEQAFFQEPGTDRQQTYAAYPANSTVCYEFEGCFSNNPPFTNTGNYLPDHPDNVKTKVWLFTRQNQDIENGQELDYKNAHSLENTNFDKTRPLKIVIHGFSNNLNSPWILPLVQAILSKDDANVFAVDWGLGAPFPFYNNASSNIRLVGAQLGRFVNQIRSVYYPSNPRALNIHCIGHSLGAHTCAHASNAAAVRFNRISGMDTAGPFFEDNDALTRLDPTDADFVDAYHTNGGTLLSASFGIVMPVGHVDFYINGGKYQPGCPGLGSILGGILNGGGDPTKEVGCSHNRAILFFTESINSPCPFIGFACNNYESFMQGECISCQSNKCTVMGYYADKYRGRGSMYLATNADSPFCGYHHLFEMRVSSDSSKTAGEIAVAIKEVTNNKPKPITDSIIDIKPGDVIKKVFITEHDLLNVEAVELNFKKKSKPFWGKDPNAPKFSVDMLKIVNLEIDETFTQCGKHELEDSKAQLVEIKEGECAK